MAASVVPPESGLKVCSATMRDVGALDPLFRVVLVGLPEVVVLVEQRDLGRRLVRLQVVDQGMASVAYDGSPPMYQGYSFALPHSVEPVASEMLGTQFSFM